MPNLGNLLLPALIFTVVGFVIGVLVAYFFADRGKEKSPAPPAQEEKPAPRPASDEPYTGLPLERFDPLARLYREKSTGKLVTEVDRKIYLTRETLPAENIRSLREAAESWCNWLGIEREVPAAEALNALKPPLPDSSVLAATLIPLEKPRATSIVGQIDEVLQEMLPDSPFSDHSIRLTQEANMGVVVWVDRERFNGIDTVPDEGIQQFIRAAVKKWEENSSALSH